MTLDPFAHHPELRDKIADPETSFFRSFRAEHAVAQGWGPTDGAMRLYSDAEREANRRAALADRPAGELWVFAYGSLMWDPAFRFSEVRRARVPNYARHFILKDTFGARGTKDAPGLMAALDHGDGCEGLLFRIAGEEVEAETEILWRREMVGPAYRPAFVTAFSGEDATSALTFVADHAAETICPDLTREEQVRFIASGTGFLGSSLEYLVKINRQFSALGIEDDYCAALLREVEVFREAR